MRAVVMDRFGPSEVLHLDRVDDPIPAAGQVLIDVEFAGITFVETQLRSGKPPVEAMRPRLPVVLGNAVTGTVAAVAPDVDDMLIGTRVASSLSGSGGYAPWAVADAHRLVPVPAALPSEQAVALIADGRTALALLDAVGRDKLTGRTVLVEAAAGGIGSLLVQLLSAAGARVVATANGERKLAMAAGLGAAVTVDYAQDGWEHAVRTRAGEIDLALDGVGGDIGTTALRLVRAAGAFLAYGGAAGAGVLDSTCEAGRPDVERITMGPLEVTQQVRLAREAIELAACGRLQAVVGQVFDLADAAAAHEAMENRATIGKTLLRIR